MGHLREYLNNLDPTGLVEIIKVSSVLKPLPKPVQSTYRRG